MFTFLRSRTLMIVAIVLGLAAVVVGQLSLHAVATRAQGDQRNLIPVVVVANDLRAGTRLERGMLQVVRVPHAAVPAAHLEVPDSCVGKVLRNDQIGRASCRERV